MTVKVKSCILIRIAWVINKILNFYLTGIICFWILLPKVFFLRGFFSRRASRGTTITIASLLYIEGNLVRKSFLTMIFRIFTHLRQLWIVQVVLFLWYVKWWTIVTPICGLFRGSWLLLLLFIWSLTIVVVLNR